MLSRPPCPALAPFVALLWAAPGRPAGTPRERVLPTGLAHLVLRLDGSPLALDAGPVGPALIGGARAAAYLKDLTAPSPTVGVQFRPGGAACLLGVPADALAGRHSDLADLWGPDAERLLTVLADEPDPAARLDRLEAWLLARLHDRLAPPAWLRPAARALAAGRPVAEVAAATGYGPRRFDTLFARHTGLGPQAFARVRRFQALVAAVRAGTLADAALAAGYADQAHATRAFKAHAGLTPGAYRARAARDANHVPEPIRSVQDAPAPPCDAGTLKGGPRGHS